jgi:hypothetical protein
MVSVGLTLALCQRKAVRQATEKRYFQGKYWRLLFTKYIVITDDIDFIAGGDTDIKIILFGCDSPTAALSYGHNGG